MSKHFSAGTASVGAAGGARVVAGGDDVVLSVRNLEKVYGGRGAQTRALDDVSLDVERGEFVAIMGASGSGKSTLLNCVSTIDSATSGRILVDGADVSSMRGRDLARFRRERLGFVFQDSNLLDTLTARENVALPLTISRVAAFPLGQVTCQRSTCRIFPS